MDTRTKGKEEVDDLIKVIKYHMPWTYQAIKDKAEVEGNTAFAWVRRGLAGEPNCFYAFEGGRVVGTPFDTYGVMPTVAQQMVQFGCAHVCIWPALVGDAQGAQIKGVGDGAR